MKKSVILWILAFIITIATAIYQRITGPTYPISGTVQLAQHEINYRLARSHGGLNDHEIIVKVDDQKIIGKIYFKRYKTNDGWTELPMEFENGFLNTYLPHQPPAGKLEYFVELTYNDTTQKFPKDNSVVIRFKGDVPLSIIDSSHNCNVYEHDVI